MQVRKATTRDVEEIQKLLSIVWEQTYNDIIPTHIRNFISSSWHSATNLLSQINNPNQIFLVAEEQEKIVGILSGKIQNEIFNLGRLYVLSTFQRRGIGKALLNYLISSLKINGIGLKVEKENQSAFFL